MRIMVGKTNVRVKTFEGRNGKPSRDVFEQEVGLDQGGSFPLQLWVEIAHDKPYAQGVYDLDPSSVRASQYGKPELNPFGIRLVPIQGATK